VYSVYFPIIWIKRDIFQNAGRSADSVRTDKIYDGDTVGAVVNGRFEKIRLLGIDALKWNRNPGAGNPGTVPGPFKSFDFQGLLEYDLEQRDKYGRILAYIGHRTERC